MPYHPEEVKIRSLDFQDAPPMLSASHNAEEQLKKQSEWLRITLSSIGDAVISTDADGAVSFLNSVAESLTGWTSKEALGKPLSDIFHIVNEHTRKVCVNPALRALELGTVVGLANHTILIAKDGSERPIDDSAAPIRDEKGVPVGAVLVFRDVTERKKAEATQAMLASIVESSQDAILSKNLNGVIQTWNAGATRLFGYTAQEAIGKHVTLLIPKDRQHEEDLILARLRSGEIIDHYETVRQSKDGKLINISLCISPMRDHEGIITGASKVARDITQRVQDEEKLRQGEEQIRLALEAGNIGFWDWDILNGRISWSDRIAEFYGMKPGEFDGTLAMFARHQHPEDAERARLAIRASVKEGVPYRIEYRIVQKSGAVRWLFTSGKVMKDNSGTPIRMIGAARDITEQKLAEAALKENEERYRLAALEASQAAEANAKFRAFFEQGTHFAGLLSLDGTVIEANRLWIDACGYLRENVLGKSFWDGGWWYRLPDLQEMIKAGCEQAASGKVFRKETQYFTADGSERMIDLSLAPVTDKTGHTIFIAATGIDVTERKHMEDALRTADRKKDDFIALLAHELRNPLAPLRNGLEVLRLANAHPEAITQARDMMKRQLGHMVRLIDDLLDISRINRNKMELRRSSLNLADVINSAVETARPVIESFHHQLTITLPEEPIYIQADLTRLAQVFSNLLTNSAKYTEKQGQIWLSAERESNVVKISVRDTGIGIPADSLPHIFNMFSQVDRSLERSTGGLGIGLALVKGLTEMHGGTVSVQSKGLGHGSIFTITLPILETEKSNSTLSSDIHHPQVSTQRRILVVDDNHDSAESMTLMLELLHHQVETAHDGIAAVEMAEKFLPQVILMDVGMPRLNGLDATRRIRQQPWGQAIIIIALTGWGQESDKVRSQQAGCNGHLVKPVSLADLEKTLTDILATKSAF